MRYAIHVEVDWGGELRGHRGPHDHVTNDEFLCQSIFDLIVKVGDAQGCFLVRRIKEEPSVVVCVSEGFDVSEKAPYGLVVRRVEPEIDLSDIHGVASLYCALLVMVWHVDGLRLRPLHDLRLRR